MAQASTLVAVPPPPLIDGNSDQADWPSYGRDLWNTRHNPTEPDHTSVRQPRILWKVDLGSDVSATPSIVGDMVYVGAINGQVAALSAASGSPRWSVNLNGERVSASVAVSDGRVFVPTLSGNLWALDQATGATLWKADLSFGMTDVSLYGSPVLSGGTLYIGVSSHQVESTTALNFHGSTVALDPATGAVRWTRFFASGAEYGVGVWATPAVYDDKLFIGTGNSLAKPVSPYSDSMIGLNASTGRINWSRQAWPNDAFRLLNPLGGPDYDFGASPNLFWIGSRLVMGEGAKSGDYRAVDARTGAPIWSGRYTNGGLFGGFLGSTAYANGRIHATMNNLVSHKDLRLPLLPTGGKYVTISAATGAVLHSSIMLPTVASPCVAGGVVYYSDLAGTIWARRADTGAILWSLLTAETSVSGPSVSRGTLYIGTGSVAALRDLPEASLLHHVLAIAIDGR